MRDLIFKKAPTGTIILHTGSSGEILLIWQVEEGCNLLMRVAEIRSTDMND